MTTNNDCEGCVTVVRCKYTQKDHDKCPCRICLIKVMCEKICEEYLQFTGDVYRQRNKHEYKKQL